MSAAREKCREFNTAASLEWLETNFTGAYAMGTVAGVNSRRYHALFTPAVRPPAERRVLLSRTEETVISGTASTFLGCVQYPGRVVRDGFDHLREFHHVPCPRWRFQCADLTLEKSLFLVEHRQVAVLRYLASAPCRLSIRPFLADRDHHALQQARDGFQSPLRLVAPGAVFRPGPDWYYRQEYLMEQQRGFEFREDLFTPGAFEVDLHPGVPFFFVAALDEPPPDLASVYEARLRRPLHPASVFLARRPGAGWTLVAGFPWFADWGRDSMIALPGLLLTSGSYDHARSVLETFAAFRRQGLIPNRFPDAGEEPDYSAADATLWWFIAAHHYLLASGDRDFLAGTFLPAAAEILDWYLHGTLHGIAVDPADGLLSAGSPDTPLTWMDARAGGRPVTPRHGKAVELNALLYNAFRIAAHWCPALERFDTHASQLRRSFHDAFWNPVLGCLNDTATDPTLRPNQILAVGLPFALLEAGDARAVVDAVQRHLLTPVGLRTLAPFEPQYRPHYHGGPEERDSAYHQGPAWAWLLGPFFNACHAVTGGAAAFSHWLQLWLASFESRLEDVGCLGSVPELFDAEEPYTPRGAPAQAWSAGELLRLKADRR
jgi:glycogen debranching enzyme